MQGIVSRGSIETDLEGVDFLLISKALNEYRGNELEATQQRRKQQLTAFFNYLAARADA